MPSLGGSIILAPLDGHRSGGGDGNGWGEKRGLVPRKKSNGKGSRAKRLDRPELKTIFPKEKQLRGGGEDSRRRAAMK